MPEGKKDSFISGVLVVNQVVNNDMTWHPISNNGKQKATSSD